MTNPQPPTPPSEPAGRPVGGQHVGEPVVVPEPPAPGRSDGDTAATYCATLVDEWVRAGLSTAVVSPGSRSTPMAVALAEHPRVRVQLVHDERSAAFTALGSGLATGVPAVVLCTSGTAATHFHGAVVEAHQAAVPMIVITADRPAELQGVGAPQTIDQRDLYGGAVRWYCEPGVPADDGAAWWRDLARDAWTRTLGTPPGPVHLNLAFREPLVGTPSDLPPAREPLPRPAPGAQWGLVDEELARLAPAVSAKRGVIVAGARAAANPAEAASIHALAEALGWPVLADAPSRCRTSHPSVVTTFDQLLRHAPFADAQRPEVVLRIGGLLASRVTNEWLARSGALQVGIDRFGLVPDPEQLLTRSFPADVDEVCRQLMAVVAAPAPTGWASTWRDAERAARGAIERVLAAHVRATEPAAAIDALLLTPHGGTLVASSSMPVRDLEWFAPARDDVRVLSNRGANGIDGVTSTAVGVALTWTPTVALVGDVAFLHDTNGLLGLARRGVSLVIVVVDNDGGGIFSFLPQRGQLEPHRFEELFGTPHGVDVVAVAEAHGVPAERVSSRAGLQAAITGAFTRGGPRVVAVTTGREDNVAVHRELAAAVAAALGGGRGSTPQPTAPPPASAPGPDAG